MQDIYPWLKPLWTQWQTLSETHKVPNAMLCRSLQGSGIDQLIERFIYTLVCSHSTTESCGFCHSCELAKSGNHPDIHWVTPEKEGKAIIVDQVRLCNKWALESSQLGGKRVIVISPAESMNESASNALLKTLESPPEHCIFLLLASNQSKLLPTVMSRCQKWQLTTPCMEDTYQWLQTQTRKTVNYVGIRLCNGAPIKALDFFQQDLYNGFQKMEIALYNLLVSKELDYNQVWLTVKEDSYRSLTWLSILMGDIQKVHFNVHEQGMCEKSKELATIIPYEVAYRAMLSINEIKDQLERFSGLNAELLLIRWLIELQEGICS